MHQILPYARTTSAVRAKIARDVAAAHIACAAVLAATEALINPL